ncbi:MAG: class I SAM-dependent methyltransferase [Alphaproteobacteria bacterium]|nr:class I SAM-dependent methyltransferase [Alphaproteobacteria bacterium]
MGWQIFDADADKYEAWYGSAKGRRADQSERKLLAWLLRRIPEAASILEVGCGTGHFTAWFADQGLFTIGLDRAPTMLATLHRRHPTLPSVLGDARTLPFQDGAVDVTAFVTTLEFLEQPEEVLAEAVRASRRGLILVVLNTWSIGGLSRRWGRQARSDKLGQARDHSLPQLAKLVRAVASDRIQRLWWMSALYPVGPAEFLAHVPLGDVIGLAATLRPPKAT